jgi:hypothetical protein
MKTFHDRLHRPHNSSCLPNTVYLKFQDRLKSSRRYKAFESGNGVYQVQVSDSGRNFIVDLEKRVCDCGNFFEYKSPCTHAITACRYKQDDLYDYFNWTITLYLYRKTYKKAIPPISIENLQLDIHI